MSSKQRFVSSKIVCSRLEWLLKRLSAETNEAVMVLLSQIHLFYLTTTQVKV